MDRLLNQRLQVMFGIVESMMKTGHLQQAEQATRKAFDLNEKYGSRQSGEKLQNTCKLYELEAVCLK